MGGMGSGGARGWAVAAKPSTASMLRLDVRHVLRTVFEGGALTPATSTATWADAWGWSWADGSKATVSLAVRMAPSDGTGTLLLDYRRSDGLPMSQRIRLEATPCHYGGQRWWARCEGCQRRLAVLWGPPWSCRRCQGLAYRTSQLGRMGRLTAKASRLQDRLGGGGEGSLFCPPEKPKGMHWETYERLTQELEESEMRQLGMMAATLTRYRTAQRR